MISIVNRLLDFIRKTIPKDKVNRISILVILLYYYIGLMSYISFPFKPIYNFFVYSSGAAVVIRALMTILVVSYSLLVVIVNKEKIQWKWAIVFVYVLLFTLISAVLSPQTYYYIYSESLYGVVRWVKASAGFNMFLSMFLSSISDFALAFCFMFILPLVLNSKKQLLFLTIPIVILCLVECVYSLVTESDEYAKLINFVDPQYGGYNINISASFGNKQDWGAFATVAFFSSAVSFFVISSNCFKNLILKLLLILSSIVILLFTIASLCKTAIFSEIIIYLFSFLCLLLFLAKKRRYVPFFIIVSIFIIASILLVLFYVLPSFHDEGIFKKIYDFTYNYIIAKIKGGASQERTSIWLRLINAFRTYNLFFGLSKGGVSVYSQVITVEGQSALHNGLAFFFASYGIFGLAVYFILLLVLIIRILKLASFNSIFALVLAGGLCAAFSFSLLEAEVLIVSGSNPIFIFNVILCVFPRGIVLKLSEREVSCNEEMCC